MNNVLAVALGGSVFLWNAEDGTVQQLSDIGSENDHVSSVAWSGKGKYLAVGCSNASIQVRGKKNLVVNNRVPFFSVIFY